MSSAAYNEILQRARLELSLEEKNRLAFELLQSKIQKNRSITELRGLGKEIWEGINPDEYIAEERDSWDG